jgi:hypothetical protein
MKKIIILFTLLLSVASYSQKLNQYKYALTPIKFSFQKEENQYNLNVLTKMLMQKYGFESYLDNDTLPLAFSKNLTQRINVNIVDNSSLFTTKLKVELKDLNGIAIATSPEGVSREKNYFTAYNEALRMAFASFVDIKNYRFTENSNQNYIKITDNTTIESVKTILVSQLTVKPTNVGYQIVDEQGNIIYNLLKTSLKEVFIAEKNNQKGIVSKHNNDWIFEYYDENVLKSELIKVTF